MGKIKDWVERGGTAQTAWGLVSPAWPYVVTAAAGAGGSVTALAILTDWAKTLGPLGIGLIVIGVSCAVAIAASDVALVLARRRLARVQATETGKWLEKSDLVNPMSREFHTKRLLIADLASPIDNSVVGKRIIDCELVGPRNIVFMGCKLDDIIFHNCDFVVVRKDSFIQNATGFLHCNLLNVAIWRCTIFIPLDAYKALPIHPPSISLTGDQTLDAVPFPTPDELMKLTLGKPPSPRSL